MNFQDCIEVFHPLSLVAITSRVLAANIQFLIPAKRLDRAGNNRKSFKLHLLRLSRQKSSKESTKENRVSNLSRSCSLIPSSILETIWQESFQLKQGIAVEDVYCFLNENCLELDLRNCVSVKTSKKRDSRPSRLTKLLNEIPQYSPNLRHLNLSYQECLPHDFSFLVQMSQLESLKFDYCNFDSNRLESLADSASNLRNLKALSLKCAQVEDEALGYLCRKVQHLEELDFREIRDLVHWNFLAEVQHLHRLEHEDLISGMSTYLRNNGYDYTDTLPAYCNEHVQYNESTHHIHILARHLHAVFPHLVKLELLNISTWPQLFESILQLPYLQELTLLSRRMVGDFEAGLPTTIESCGNGLRSLHLSRFNSLLSLKSLVRLCPNLETLRLEHCRFQPDDDSSSASFSNRQASYEQQPCFDDPCWNKLEHLEVNNIPIPSDSNDWFLLLTPKRLKRVVLSFVDNVSIDDKFLDQLPSARIRYLALVGARQVTDKGVENLITRLSQQRYQQRDGPMPIKLVVSDCGDGIAQHRIQLVKLAGAKGVQLFLH